MERTICVNCHKQYPGRPLSAKNYRCQFCSAVVLMEKQPETSQKGAFWSCWVTKLCNSGGSPSSPSPVAGKNPNPVSCTAGHQLKRAVLCGVSYKEKKHKLRGTVNDVNRMRALLVGRFGFPENAIRVLTEEQKDPDLTPTKKNVQNALSWLVNDCKSGDSLVFYFSGHGLQQRDFDGDELDGYDETICPSDFLTAGMIFDNEINATIVKPLKEDVKLHAIIDACHSGTILDLEHVYNPKDKKWEDNRPPSGASKSTSGGLAISLSACADDQMATDTSAFTGNEVTGALTYIFVQTIMEHTRITYGDLLNEMKNKIELANKKGCLNAPFLRKLFRTNLIQECQLSSSKEFDVNAEEFKL